MRFLSAPFKSAINHRTLSSSAIHVFTTIGCTEATSTIPDVYRAKAFMFLEPLLLCRWNYHEAQSCVWKSMISASSIEPRQEVAVLRRPVANVISASLLDDLAFTLGHAFLHQEKSGPGWIHHFHAVGIWTTEVFVHSPTEGTIPQANQTGFTQDIEHVPPSVRPTSISIMTATGPSCGAGMWMSLWEDPATGAGSKSSLPVKSIDNQS
jgi:hypothetical protein